MWFLVGLTLISVGLKIWISRRLWQCRNSPVAALALGVVIISYAQSVLELYGYYRVAYPEGVDMTVLLRIYHVFVAAYLMLIWVLVISVVRSRLFLRTAVAVSILSLPMTLWFVASDDIVAGATLLNQAYTREAGEYYWVFQLIVLSSIALCVGTPALMYFTAQKELHRIKSANMLIGVAILALVCVALILMMHFGVPITASGILPVALAIYLLVVAECLRDEFVRDLRAEIPGTNKWREVRALTRHLRVVRGEPLDAKSMSKQFEEKMISAAEQLYESRKDAAASLNISEAKLSRDLARIKNSD